MLEPVQGGYLCEISFCGKSKGCQGCCRQQQQSDMNQNHFLGFMLPSGKEGFFFRDTLVHDATLHSHYIHAHKFGTNSIQHHG